MVGERRRHSCLKFQIKAEHVGTDAIENPQVARAYIENHAQKLLSYAKSQDSPPQYNPRMVKAFYAAAHLLDVLTHFGDLKDDLQVAI